MIYRITDLGVLVNFGFHYKVRTSFQNKFGLWANLPRTATWLSYFTSDILFQMLCYPTNEGLYETTKSNACQITYFNRASAVCQTGNIHPFDFKNLTSQDNSNVYLIIKRYFIKK